MSSHLYTNTGALIDESGQYRYSLWRTWDILRPRLLWIMLNPSTADGLADDPTIRRCVGFADAWGYGEIGVANLFALRATDPARLARAADPIGPDNDRYLRAGAMQATNVVCAWGAHPFAYRRAREVCVLLDDAWQVPQCLGVTKEGYPRHPLYIPATARLEPYNARWMSARTAS